MARLFLSYSREDSSRVDQLISALEAAGHEVWIDRVGTVGGEQWRRQIVDAIETSDRFLLVLSTNSVASDNVRREVDIAVESNIRIIPLDLDPIVIPSEMKYQLAGLQRIDLTHEFDVGIDSLLGVVEGESRESGTGQLSTPDTYLTTRRNRRNLGIGALVGFTFWAVYSVIHMMLNDEMRKTPLDDFLFVLSMNAMIYGIFGAITGAVLARFWQQSKAFRASTVVGTMVTAFLWIAIWLSPLGAGSTTVRDTVWFATYFAVPLGLVVGMLMGGIIVGIRKWMSVGMLDENTR